MANQDKSKTPDPVDKEPRSVMAMVGRYSTLAMMLPMSVAVGYGAGYLLDGWLGTSFLKMTFLILGVVAGMVQLIRELQKEL